ncbi:MAG: hypothetical protein SFZ24_09495 [Planctomycetota bacterium]|nr:hypothetical protein [Planctomycetota bacterium]
MPPTDEPANTAATPDPPDDAPLRRPWTPGRIAAQILGVAVGAALLIWAIRLAISGDNARALQALKDAPLSEFIILAALTLAGLVLNGLMFWVTLRPVHTLSPINVIITNAIATFLSILPFKISLVTRVLIHRQRDGVPLRLLIGWVAAMGALGLAVLLPFIAASLIRPALDLWWWTIALGGGAAGSAAGVYLGRLADRLTILKPLSFGSYVIVRHVSAVVGHAALRLLDVAVLAGRFLAGALIVDIALPIDQAVLLATTYFGLSVLTPAGTLGFREMGVAALGMSQGLDEASIAMLALVVTAAELLVSAAVALPGAAVLRLDRLLIREKKQAPGVSPEA